MGRWEFYVSNTRNNSYGTNIGCAKGAAVLLVAILWRNLCGCEEERGGDEDHLQPCRRCIECFGHARKTRQGIPASDASNAAGKQDYGKQDKTRWRKHSTLHLARRDPHLERVECHTLGMQFAIA